MRHPSLIIIPLLLGPSLPAFSQANYAAPYTFATLAGLPGGAGTNDGTGGAARFNLPTGPAVDSAGNLYVADNANDTIRKVTPAGTVTTLAGLAQVPGTNDGTGSAARFSGPSAVAVDSTGNVYVSDFDNHTIRKLTPVGSNWIVSTLAGDPGVKGTNDGVGSTARFNYPAGVAVDNAGNVYVADFFNDTIRKLTPVGTNWLVSTLAGDPGAHGTNDGAGSAARFNLPGSVIVDSAMNLYVADTGNYAIRKMTQVGTNWMVTTLAGMAGTIGTNDGTGNAARFHLPQGIAIDASSNLYVADTGNDTIRKITQVGTNWVVTTLAGVALSSGTNDGTGNAVRFYQPCGVAVDSAGNLYVADSGNDTVRRGDPSTPPQIITNNASFGFLSNQFGFNVSGAFGQTVVVDGSSNLMDWSPLSTNTVGNNSIYFFDPASTNTPWRFYRARLQ